MYELPQKEVERRALLARVETAASFSDVEELWKGDEEDWSILGAFARRHDLPVRYMEALHARNSWFLNITLCHNPSTPVPLLRRLARLREGEPVPTFIEDCEAELEADDIIRIARTVLRRRESG